MSETSEHLSGPTNVHQMAAIAHLFITNTPDASAKRTYPADLETRLYDTFELLASEEPQSFLHVDGHSVTIGSTGDERRQIELVREPGTSICSLRLDACDFVRYTTVPPQVEAPEKKTGEPLDLPLGRNIIMEDSLYDDKLRAIRDGLREGERTLVTGENMLRSYIVACLGHYGFLADSTHSNAEAIGHKRDALGQALGVLLDRRKPQAAAA